MLITIMVGILVPAALVAQSLTEKLRKEEGFYNNYGKQEYSRLKIEENVIGLYDLFGEHITDGVHLYELSNETNLLNNARLGVHDSMEYSRSLEYQKEDFYENLSNLAITQDAIGGMKTSFIIGNRISTRFTPLTFNKTNYRGIRWDVWSPGVQWSFLLSRTRPGFLSKRDRTGRAEVQYPISGLDYADPERADKYRSGGDHSDASPYGDYEWLMALHTQNTIANKIDVGLTYINHHLSDVRRGEQWLSGDVPDDWMPGEIHFEFYDMTQYNKDDAGAYVHDVTMMINGREVVPKPAYRGAFRRTFVAYRDSTTLTPAQLPIPRPQSGHTPIIVAFKTDPKYWMFRDGSVLINKKDIKKIDFRYTVAGNYKVFVSTSKQIPLGLAGEKNPQTGDTTYYHPEKMVTDIYDNNVEIDYQPSRALFYQADADEVSTTYFGKYIRQAPRILTINRSEFERVCNEENVYRELLSRPGYARDKYNFNTYEYSYRINVSSITYGLNFAGELGGIDFSGEFALNRRANKFPASGGSTGMINNWATRLNASKSLTEKLGISDSLYFLSPQWRTSLDELMPSQYFNRTHYQGKELSMYNREFGIDFLDYPKPLGGEWRNIEDNDDNDPFVENQRRTYPSDKGSGSQGDFYQDGALKNDELMPEGSNYFVLLPSGMPMIYDDPDGVITSKNDRNKNGIQDYRESFLLFQSDPPYFELGLDLNNNGVEDYYDDDLLPDYGFHVPYLITANGIQTQGVLGNKLDFSWKPDSRTVLNAGVVVENALDRDMSGNIDGLQWDEFDPFSTEWFDDKSLVGYLTAKREVLRRSIGIRYMFGNELRLISDAIRNDRITTHGEVSEGDYNVFYTYDIDPLDYRRAVLDNVVGSITYSQIRNFEYQARGRIGLEKRFAIDKDFTTRVTYFDVVTNDLIFDEKQSRYKNKLLGNFHLVVKEKYDILFDVDYSDWRAPLNFINRLKITPMYKLQYDLQKEIAGDISPDPRNLETNLRYDVSGEKGEPDGAIDTVYDKISDEEMDIILDLRFEASEFRRNNMHEVINVPIVRANYKIAENTRFELGVEWKRYLDIITSEKNHQKLTVIGNVVSESNYSGYDVTFFLGAKWTRHDYDFNLRDPVILTGSLHDMRQWTFFAKLYSGS